MLLYRSKNDVPCHQLFEILMHLQVKTSQQWSVPQQQTQIETVSTKLYLSKAQNSTQS